MGPHIFQISCVNLIHPCVPHGLRFYLRHIKFLYNKIFKKLQEEECLPSGPTGSADSPIYHPVTATFFKTWRSILAGNLGLQSMYNIWR